MKPGVDLSEEQAELEPSKVDSGFSPVAMNV
jgi:hypothetical protein